MTRRTDEALAERALERLARWAYLDKRFGVLKEAPTGTVIRFKRTYEVTGKEYSFAALKVVGGLWFLTRSMTSTVISPLTYDGLIEFLETATDVEYADTWKAVDVQAESSTD